ncbi:hypothetical protein AVEN_225206-1 [Araneus ventricosus]|uniref:Uncharacterized protein n=1 Tax=Araneus ventricosus TaxID=182803 RepID=A0A4Y2ALB6_ARAVE|nr:hypothetical protein AVEN_225206-1 [Araneus ventricosus]
MPKHCEGTFRGIMKSRASSTTTALVAVRQVKTFEVGRERAMFRQEDNIFSNPVSGTETKSSAYSGIVIGRQGACGQTWRQSMEAKYKFVFVTFKS